VNTAVIVRVTFPAAFVTLLALVTTQPTNVVFDPSGNFLYVASFGTDRVAQVDRPVVRIHSPRPPWLVAIS
jgi:DNA-binding beta-propeller fold protein YncE